MNATNFFDFFLIIGLMIVTTIIYFLVRRLIAWAMEDDNKWHKKRGHLGFSKEEIRNKKKLAYDKLTYGYFLFMSVLVLLMVMLIVM
jgi:hypothetical protein